MSLMHARERMQRIGVCVTLIASCCLVGTAVRGENGAKDRTLFDSPEDAVKAMKAAAEARDKDAMHTLFGPKLKELRSGDDVQDAQDREKFAQRLAKATKLVPDGDDSVTVLIGVEEHPFPVPIVKLNNKWFFDTDAGLEEMLNRRIGENELNAISVCHGYVAAQREYAMADHDGDDVLEYAQKLASTPGRQDGLFWEVQNNEPLSPLGPLVAEARSEGYGKSKPTDSEAPKPYQGYVFRVLTRQGRHAPGGRYDYVINGNMVAGFALIATPVQWGSSGVMTFLVGPNGKVYQKDLGKKTMDLAAKMDEFNPDSSWSATKDEVTLAD